jgi:ABC-2 family transporter protein
MLWLAWRQFRAQAALALSALVVVVLMLVATRDHVIHVFSNGGTHELTGFYVWLRLLGTALIAVPALIGAFWGAPLLTREFEDRTYRMIWTQSITRTRWLATKLAVIGVTTVAVVATFSLEFTQWSGPIDSTGNRIGTATFGSRGIVPIGYAFFGLMLGTLFGTILRKTLPAMAASLAGFMIVRIFVQNVVRSRLVSTESVNVAPFGPNGFAGWILSSRTVDASGQTISKSVAEGTLTAACDITRSTQDVDAALARCAQQFGIHDIAQVHPGHQFWALQTAELGLFVVLAAIAAAICFWWLNHRSS